MATIEYQITVASKTDAGEYGADGNAYFYDGQQAPMFQLYPGNTYKFMQEDASNDGHLLKVSLAFDGTHGGGSAYTTGVTHVGTPGNSGAYTQVVVDSDTPDDLHYYCINHAGMGSDLDIDHHQPVDEYIVRTDSELSLSLENKSPALLLETIPTSDVSTANDTITLTGHGYENNFIVSYKANGGTVLAGLADSGVYYIIKVDANTFKLSSSSGGSAITLTGTGNNAQTIALDEAIVVLTTTTQLDRDLAHATVMASEIDDMDDDSFNWSWIKIDFERDFSWRVNYDFINLGSNTIEIPAHGLSANNVVTYTTTDAVINGLTSGTSYYAIITDANNIQLAATSGGSAIALSEPSDSGDAAAETIEYAITVAAVDGTYGDTGNAYYYEGVQSSYCSLIKGNTYKFMQEDASNDGHLIRFSTTSDGTHNSGSAYTTGVTEVGTPGNSGAYTQIVVAADAPETLYYYCINHAGMGSSITIGVSGIGDTIHSHHTFTTPPVETALNGSADVTDPTEGPYAPSAAEKQLYLNKYITHLTYLAGLSDWGSTDISVITAAVTKANNISF